jgi:rRNA biogenesis protein RRP5
VATADTGGKLLKKSAKVKGGSINPSKRKSSAAAATVRSAKKSKSARRQSGLSHKSLAPGMLLMAAVREVHEHHLLLSLPNLLTAVARIGDIVGDLAEDGSDDEESDEEGVEDDDEEDDEDGKTGAKPTVAAAGGSAAAVYELRTAFAEGDVVACAIVAIESKTSSTQIRVSLRPEAVNGALNEASLTEGRTVWCAVASVEDHGYTMDLGVPGVQAFLTKKAAAAYLKSKGRRALVPGDSFHCALLSTVSRGQVAKLTADPSKVREARATSATNFTLADLTPGLLVRGSHLTPGVIHIGGGSQWLLHGIAQQTVSRLKHALSATRASIRLLSCFAAVVLLFVARLKMHVWHSIVSHLSATTSQ